MIERVPHLRPAAWNDPDVQALTAAQQTELRRRYGEHTEPGVSAPAADVAVVLEAAALERDWTTLRLETGPRQPEAVALYTGAGYRRIGAFGHYVRPDQNWSPYVERSLA
jgi:hypothetical protein